MKFSNLICFGIIVICNNLTVKSLFANPDPSLAVLDSSMIDKYTASLKQVVEKPDDAALMDNVLRSSRVDFKNERGAQCAPVMVAAMVRAFGQREVNFPGYDSQSYNIIAARLFLERAVIFKNLLPMIDSEDPTTRSGVDRVLQTGEMLIPWCPSLREPPVFWTVIQSGELPEKLPYRLVQMMFVRNAEAAAATMNAPASVLEEMSGITTTLRDAQHEIAADRIDKLKRQVLTLSADKNWIARLYAISVAREMVEIKLIKTIEEVLPGGSLKQNENISSLTSQIIVI